MILTVVKLKLIYITSIEVMAYRLKIVNVESVVNVDSEISRMRSDNSVLPKKG